MFHDLFAHNNPVKFGGESVEGLENQISEFYSVDQQKKMVLSASNLCCNSCIIQS